MTLPGLTATGYCHIAGYLLENEGILAQVAAVSMGEMMMNQWI